jgi:hypothetical protein
MTDESTAQDNRSAFEKWWWNQTDESIAEHNAQVKQKPSLADAIKAIAVAIREQVGVVLDLNWDVTPVDFSGRSVDAHDHISRIWSYTIVIRFPDTYAAEFDQPFSAVSTEPNYVRRYRYSCPTWGWNIDPSNRESILHMSYAAVDFYIKHHKKDKAS